jgi:hypothetical protein
MSTYRWEEYRKTRSVDYSEKILYTFYRLNIIPYRSDTRVTPESYVIIKAKEELDEILSINGSIYPALNERLRTKNVRFEI